MLCAMFPGQPLANEASLPTDRDFGEIAQLTRERTGLDLATFTWAGEPASGQVALQIYGTALSLHGQRLLRQGGKQPGIIAEHSMGIYPALAATGAFPEGEALELTGRIGRCLATMSGTTAYALGCVIGLPGTPVLALAENNNVYLANHNTSRHFLLAGEQHAVEDAMAEALVAGAFSVRTFPCDAPLHTPLVEAIAPQLRQIIVDYTFREPNTPLLEHIRQDCLTAADIPLFLEQELSQPVYWEATYLALRRAGVTAWQEVGRGDALKKYNRWIAAEQP
jgi:malonyl CoA-acyl carrier protein transacylase